MSDAIIVALIGLAGIALPILVSNHSLSKDIKEIKQENKEQSLSILRLTVMADEMPISERLIAGRKYIDRGGNGDVKHYYHKLVEEHTK